MSVLPKEYENLLKQVKDLEERRFFRKSLKNHFEVIYYTLWDVGRTEFFLEHGEVVIDDLYPNGKIEIFRDKKPERETDYRWSEVENYLHLQNEKERLPKQLKNAFDFLEKTTKNLINHLKQQLIDDEMELSEHPIFSTYETKVEGEEKSLTIENKTNKLIPDGVFVSSEGSNLLNTPNGFTDDAFERIQKLDLEFTELVTNHPKYKTWGIGSSYEGDERDPDEMWRCYSLHSDVEEGQPFIKEWNGKKIMEYKFQLSSKGRIQGDTPQDLFQETYELVKTYKQPQKRIWDYAQQ